MPIGTLVGAVGVVSVIDAEGREAGELRQESAHGERRDIHAIAATDNPGLGAGRDIVSEAAARGDVEVVGGEELFGLAELFGALET